MHTPEWKGNLTFGKLDDPFVFSPIGLGMGLGIDPDYTPEVNPGVDSESQVNRLQVDATLQF